MAILSRGPRVLSEGGDFSWSLFSAANSRPASDCENAWYLFVSSRILVTEKPLEHTSCLRRSLPQESPEIFHP